MEFEHDLKNQSAVWQLAKAVLLYPAAYLTTFPLVVMLKDLGGNGVGPGTLKLAGAILCPSAFIVLGFAFGRRVGALTHIICLLSAYQIAKPSIARMNEVVGGRAFAYIWPGYLPWIYLAGWVMSVIIIAIQMRSKNNSARELST